MKIHHLGTAAAAQALFVGLAQAGPISEDFDYAPGILSNQSGGTGWLGPWTAGSTVVVAAGSLNYPGLTSSGNRSVFSTNNYASSGATRRIGMGADGTTLWLSFLMRTDGITDGLDGYLLFGPSTGNYLRVGKIDSDSFWSVRRDGTADIASTTPIVAGTTALFVMRFDFNADPNADDTVSLYIDPTSGAAPGAPVATYSNNNFSSFFTSMSWGGGMNTFNATPGLGSICLDGFRSGDSYAAVAPTATVPEGTSAALVALGLLLSGAATRRSRRQPCGILRCSHGHRTDAATDSRDPAASAVWRPAAAGAAGPLAGVGR